ncbi:uncharacterized protein LOC126803822 [Argentina anserina]|uniref:uncharacterized protein LOC126803822 n=1 Tax=Argentina anserina TaxID=57926 RepID=UPI0021763CBA|nr:uncharacterized protein LOC126803822 [Potentilla anserina]
MAACESGPMFLRAENCERESKDKHFISDLLIDTILEIGPQHVVQVITDNASNCKVAGAIINARFPHIFWTPCVVHTVNLALKNICTPSSIVSNRAAYDECNWISQIADDVYFVKNFIMNHEDVTRMSHVFTRYMSVGMIEEVKVAIYKEECKEYEEESPFYNVVYSILLARWTKSSTLFHCMAHSLNPRYYSMKYLNGAPNRIPPHQDSEIAKERKECLKKYFANEDERRMVNEEFASFSACLDEFASSDSMNDRDKMDPIKWWIVHGDDYDTMVNVNGGMLEIANLSLDEPDLEGVIFDNKDEDD